MDRAGQSGSDRNLATTAPWVVSKQSASGMPEKWARALPHAIRHNLLERRWLHSRSFAENPLMLRRPLAWTLLLSLLIPLSASAELVRWEITKREPYAGGKPRGDAGPYEQWTGTVSFAIDPSAAASEQMVDLKLAPRNAAGKVEFSADFRM